MSEKSAGYDVTQDYAALDAARAALEADKRRRAQACGEAIQAALDAHGCQLVAVPFFTADGRIGARVELAAEGLEVKS